MRNKRKTLKGFTLVELLIVLAIFSIIMTLVISFIDPVTTLMTKTSIKERTAAYSDNINEYIENSLRYASKVYVYDGGFADVDQVELDKECTYTAGTAEVDEIGAVKALIERNFDGAISNSAGDPITGKVRVLKLMNDEGGRAVESVYRFTSGNLFVNDIPKGTDGRDVVEDLITPIEITAITEHQDINVLNPDCFQFYNYYYSIGNMELSSYSNIVNPDSEEAGPYSNFESLSWNSDDEQLDRDPVTSSEDLREMARNKYTHLVAMDGLSTTETDPTRNNFPVNIIAYSNNELAHISATNSAGEFVDHFKTPAHMDTTTISLINAKKGKRNSTFYKKKYVVEKNDDDEVTGISESIEDGKTEYVKVASDPFDYIRSNKDNNIYIVFVLPYEIDNMVVEED